MGCPVNRLWLCCFTGVALLCVCEAWAQESVASLKNIQGVVTVFTFSGQSKTVGENTFLSHGDGVSTGVGGEVDIVWKDGSVSHLFPGSSLRIQHRPEAFAWPRALRLYVGRIWNTMVKMDQKEGFGVYTTSGVLGVRGTAFGVAVAENSALLAYVDEGAVAAVMRNGTTELRPGSALWGDMYGVKKIRENMSKNPSWEQWQQEQKKSFPKDLVKMVQKFHVKHNDHIKEAVRVGLLKQQAAQEQLRLHYMGDQGKAALSSLQNEDLRLTQELKNLATEVDVLRGLLTAADAWLGSAEASSVENALTFQNEVRMVLNEQEELLPQLERGSLNPSYITQHAAVEGREKTTVFSAQSMRDVEQMLGAMGQAVKKIAKLRSEATQEQDVIKGHCLDEYWVMINSYIPLAQGALTRYHSYRAVQDTESMLKSFERLKSLYLKTEEEYAQALSCKGSSQYAKMMRDKNQGKTSVVEIFDVNGSLVYSSAMEVGNNSNIVAQYTQPNPNPYQLEQTQTSPVAGIDGIPTGLESIQDIVVSAPSVEDSVANQSNGEGESMGRPAPASPYVDPALDLIINI
jgi:hypothetical protein